MLQSMEGPVTESGQIEGPRVTQGSVNTRQSVLTGGTSGIDDAQPYEQFVWGSTNGLK